MKSSVEKSLTNSIISGLGILLIIPFMVLFIIKANKPVEVVLYTLFTSFIIIHYIFKILYYSLNKGTAKTTMKVLERNISTIVLYFLLLIINITYIKGIMGWLIFSLFIPVAIVGVIFNSIFNKKTSIIWIIMNSLLCLGSLTIIKGIILEKIYVSFILLGILIPLGIIAFIFSGLNKKSFNIISNILYTLTLIGINLFLYLYII